MNHRGPRYSVTVLEACSTLFEQELKFTDTMMKRIDLQAT